MQGVQLSLRRHPLMVLGNVPYRWHLATHVRLPAPVELSAAPGPQPRALGALGPSTWIHGIHALPHLVSDQLDLRMQSALPTCMF